MPFRPSPALLPLGAGALAAAWCLSGCGTREVSFSYVKPGMTEAAMHDDEAALQATPGVVRVYGRIDDRDSVILQLFLDESNPRPGEDAVEARGYKLVRN